MRHLQVLTLILFLLCCSPVNPEDQSILNENIVNKHIFRGLLPLLQKTGEAVMNRAVVLSPQEKPAIAKNLALSQFRYNDPEPYLENPITLFAYPVFDSFQEDRKLTGVLTTYIYWNLFLPNILPDSASGYVCIIENSYNQTLAYVIDGSVVTFLGEGDPHDAYKGYEYLEYSADVNAFVEQQAGPNSRSYTTVPLNKDYGRYRLRIYPTHATREEFESNKPLVFSSVVIAVMVLTSTVLLLLDRIVARRQRIVVEGIIKAAEEAREIEHELNAFLAHEVRK